MKRTTFLLTLAALLLLVSSALAMSSSNYRLDWFTPLTSNSGGDADSTNYAASLTVGQSLVGAASSANYAACLGYWCGDQANPSPPDYNIYLPTVLRNS